MFEDSDEDVNDNRPRRDGKCAICDKNDDIILKEINQYCNGGC